METQNKEPLSTTREENSPHSHIPRDTDGYQELFERLWRLYCTSLDAEQTYKEQVRACRAEIKEMRGVIVKLVDQLLALKK